MLDVWAIGIFSTAQNPNLFLSLVLYKPEPRKAPPCQDLWAQPDPKMDEDDRCEQCGSTVLEVEDDGRTYCENGHDQGRAPVTADDDLDFARQGKVIRKKERKEKQKISGGKIVPSVLARSWAELIGPSVLHGIKAYQLFLQSWQLILRKQCYALVHQKGLPPELWVSQTKIAILAESGHRELITTC